MSKEKIQIFLGGTTAGKDWRKDFIEHLEDEGINYFNPVVDDWDEEARKKEEKEKKKSDYRLYVLTSDMEGVYSVAEVVEDSVKHPKKTILYVDKDGFDKHQLKSLEATKKKVEDNGGKICNALPHVINWIKYDLKEKGKEELIGESNTGDGSMEIDKISHSDIYGYLDKTINVGVKLQKFIKDSKRITRENTQIDFMKFDDNAVPFKNNINNHFEDDKIEILYNANSAMSKSLLFIPMFKNKHDYKLYINATSLCKEKEDVENGVKKFKYEFISDYNLENLLVAGYTLMYIASKPNTVRHNFKVRKSLFELHSEIILGTLNRMSSVATNKENVAVIKYILCKFLHLKMLDLPHSGTLENTCRTMSEADGNDKLKVLEMNYDADDFKSFKSVLKIIEDVYPQIKIDVASFVPVHTQLFGELGLLCIDYVPYLIAMAFSEKTNFSIYSQGKNLKRNYKLPAHKLQADLLTKIK